MRGLDMMAGTPAPRKYTLYDVDNRNKRCIVINLKQEQGRQIVYRLIREADVFVTNYRTAALERLGMDYETLAKMNPRLIYAYCSGYGDKGSEKDKPSFDSGAYWTRGGFLLQLGESENHPVPQRYAGLGDQPSGMYAAGGIALALYVRERTGTGQRVSSSLLHSALWTTSLNVQGAMERGEIPPGSRKEIGNPLNNCYQTKDGKWLYLLMLQSDRFWHDFCQAMGLAGLEHDPKFNSLLARATNHRELVAVLDEVFASRTRDEWADKFRNTSIMWDPANTFADLAEDPQALVNDCFVRYEHPTKGDIKIIASPIQLNKTPATIRRHAPEFGEHTEEVLLELGYSWEDVSKLKEAKIIP